LEIIPTNTAFSAFCMLFFLSNNRLPFFLN
jgi:hypothetical protein